MTGAVSVHLSKPHGSFKEAFKLMKYSECKSILLDPENDNSFIDDMKSYWQDDKTKAKNTSDFLGGPGVVLLKSCVDCDLPDVETLGQDETKNDVQLPTSICPETTAIIYMTSGSTGNPKQVEHSHFGLVNTPFGFKRLQDKTRTVEVVYNDRPFSWMGGSIIPCLLHGNTHVFREGGITVEERGVFDIWRIIVEEKCTSAFLFEITILDLLENEAEILKNNYRLNTIITGQIINTLVADAQVKFCNEIVTVYGSSEMNIMMANAVDYNLVIGKFGYLYEGVEVKIVDDKSKTLPREHFGEICMKSPWMLRGYRNASTKQVQALSDGWMKTSDIGRIDIKGNLFIKGRKEDVITRFSLQIFSGEVEECIADLPEVRRVVVIAIPDTRANEEMCACVVFYQSSKVTIAEVKSHCRERLGDNITGHSPKYYLQFETIPTLATGKEDRVKIRRDALKLLNIEH
ncbi:Long-chain-fatty-acid--CoA ligase [Mizuhopecten yessoensis]|uniref:Long-chain-fatty-acid--CoA ligase n=1 Tax=Mizuhopecten yessoensis TaxID=6573 RepID=A0A210R641_MIZYE|nr:Long-chain-fatty-acid--CoA ligase [Mizuhopecten yessoensis]